jgi:hypothetical protein
MLVHHQLLGFTVSRPVAEPATGDPGQLLGLGRWAPTENNATLQVEKQVLAGQKTLTS